MKCHLTVLYWMAAASCSDSQPNCPTAMPSTIHTLRAATSASSCCSFASRSCSCMRSCCTSARSCCASASDGTVLGGSAAGVCISLHLFAGRRPVNGIAWHKSTGNKRDAQRVMVTSNRCTCLATALASCRHQLLRVAAACTTLRPHTSLLAASVSVPCLRNCYSLAPWKRHSVPGNAGAAQNPNRTSS
jgi:hypothetical protein